MKSERAATADKKARAHARERLLASLEASFCAPDWQGWEQLRDRARDRALDAARENQEQPEALRLGSILESWARTRSTALSQQIDQAQASGAPDPQTERRLCEGYLAALSLRLELAPGEAWRAPGESLLASSRVQQINRGTPSALARQAIARQGLHEPYLRALSSPGMPWELLNAECQLCAASHTIELLKANEPRFPLEACLGFFKSVLEREGANALPPDQMRPHLPKFLFTAGAHPEAFGNPRIIEITQAWERLQPTPPEAWVELIGTIGTHFGNDKLISARMSQFRLAGQALPELLNATDARGRAWAYHLNEAITLIAEKGTPACMLAADQGFTRLCELGMDASLIIARPQLHQASASPCILALAEARALRAQTKESGAPRPSAPSRSL